MLDTILAQIDTDRPVLTYKEFRTGLLYVDIYYLIWSRPHKRRRGVLGKWHELKRRMYEEYERLYYERIHLRSSL